MDISIIVATYKRPKLLKRALTSILSQENISQLNIEIIITDDDPEGSGFSVLENFICYPQQILYIKSDKFSNGVAGSRNRATALSKGKWLLYLDDDDQILPNSIFNLHSYAETHALDFCAGHYIKVWEDESLVPVTKEIKQVGWGGTYNLLLQNIFPIGSYIIKRAAIVHKFDPKMKSHEDWLFLLENLHKKNLVVGITEQAVVSIHMSINQERIQRNPRGNEPLKAKSYAIIYALFPDSSLTKARLKILNSFCALTLEDLIM
jgi:glycosyltransferase involved in cell wall biosynthesis